MKYLVILLFVAGTLTAAKTQAQAQSPVPKVYKIEADSTKLTGCDSNELIIENHTQATKGFLFNTGNGRTIFQKGLIRIDDTTYLIGADTLRSIPPSYGWMTTGNGGLNVTNNFLGTKDSVGLVFRTNNIERGRWLPGNGNLGLGTTSPTAKLHLGAGSAAAGSAPMKLTSGPLMTAGEAGAIEFLTDKAYLGITTGNARKEFTLNEAPLLGTAIPYVSGAGRLLTTNFLTYDPSYNTLKMEIPQYSAVGWNIVLPMDNRIGIQLTNTAANTPPNRFSTMYLPPGVFYNGKAFNEVTSTAENVQMSNWMQIQSDDGGVTAIYQIASRLNSTATSQSVPYNVDFQVNSDGNANLLTGIYIGDVVTDPTAMLNIAPSDGTAGRAPVKLTAGTLLSTAEDGAIEYDGTDLYATRGTVRYKLSRTLTGSLSTNFGGGSLAAFSAVTATVTIAGAATGNVVAVSANSGAVNPPSIMISAYVSSTNTITIRAYNASSSATTLGSDTYQIKVLAN